jgi:hypothetical protein
VNWTPNGSPPSDQASGRDIAGFPVELKSDVNPTDAIAVMGFSFFGEM